VTLIDEHGRRAGAASTGGVVEQAEVLLHEDEGPGPTAGELTAGQVPWPRERPVPRGRRDRQDVGATGPAR